MKELTFTQEDGFYVAEVETNGEPIAVQVNRKYFPYPHDYSLEVLGRIDPSMPWAPVQMFDYKSPRNIIVYQNIPVDGYQLKLRSRTEVESAGYLRAKPTAQIVIPTEEQVGFENPLVNGGYIELMAIYANAVSPDLLKMYIDDNETELMEWDFFEITTDFAIEIPFLANYVGQFCYYTLTYTELEGTHSLRLKIGDLESEEVPIFLLQHGPVPSITVTNPTENTAIIEIEAEGADGLYYSYNDYDWIPYTGPITDSIPGTKTISANAVKEGCRDSYASESYTVNTEPLCFTSQQDGSTIGMMSVLADKPNLEYSSDRLNWQAWTFSGNDTAALTLDEGEKIYVRGSNKALSFAIANYSQFVMTGKIAASGNINALIETESLSLAKYCYHFLFCGCTSLVTAPELPATTLAPGCYEHMFNGCTSLATAPELPATTLAKYCYSYMFCGCTSLVTAPELPATTLESLCYSSMFSGCTALNSVTVGAMSWDFAPNGWLDGVAASGTFTKPAGTDIPTGTDGIPNGWTVVNV